MVGAHIQERLAPAVTLPKITRREDMKGGDGTEQTRTCSIALDGLSLLPVQAPPMNGIVASATHGRDLYGKSSICMETR